MERSALLPQVEQLMRSNQRTVGEHTYTVPSPESYPYQWLWDSCFHAIIYTHFDTDAAKAELRALLHHQHESGLIGHITYWQEPGAILNIDWGTLHTSSLTQPPLIAYAAWRVYAATDDVSFLAELYPKLVAYYDYLWRERRLTERGLIGIINPDESGEDNSPRFDQALQLPHQHDASKNTAARYELFTTHKTCNHNASCTSNTFWVEDLPFNCITLANLNVLADIATAVDKRTDASRWRNRAVELGEAIKSTMRTSNGFVSLSGREGTPIRSDTWARFVPLFAELYNHADAGRLIHETLMNPDTFWLPHGIPTVARTDPAFDPLEPSWGEAWQRPHWRGPVWMATHWFIVRGLRKYGFSLEANEIARKSRELIAQNGFREYFDPLTGAGMGAEQFTWGGLVLDME